ncbi:Hypothetical protein R9X50_00222000 [Acrodontium crateriforme]|uniref:Enoyl reductase (ER) domain-containing protein n=1 Tax=Acrodontium crateriforme TaxID=150365 RepID=A0AAQ3M1V0_9PEZI|nr:Hypothetical protein R9X50_00222000 [Acrodontium crateriforme]
MSGNKAAWLDGKAAQLRIAEAEMYEPEKDEVLIKNGAVAINPVDWKIQDYGIFLQQWPNIIGTDSSGEVVKIGSGVQNVKVGDRVAAHLINLKTNQPKHGAFQLYSIAKAATVARIPDSISFTQAAVLPLAIDTAGTGLYDSAEQGKGLGLEFPSLNPKPSGKTIVVWGGSSSVGAMATQLATASGAHVVAVASRHNFDFCKTNGAKEVYDYNSSSVAADVASAVSASGGEFVGIFDAISSAESYQHDFEIFRHLDKGGVLVCTVMAPKPEEWPANVKANMVFGVSEVPYPLWKDFVTSALEKGVLTCAPEPLVVGKGLESIQAGMDANKKGVSAKKVVIEL